MQTAKAHLREHFLQLRREIPETEARELATIAADNFINSIKLKKVRTIALYIPIRGEIDPLPLIDKVLKVNNDITFALPVVAQKESPLSFYPWQAAEELLGNRFYKELLEPKIKDNPIVPDVILVPMVAFDEKRHRLGYGAGFYDRTLADLNAQSHAPVTVGYAYECQKTPSPIMASPHDIPLDFIITESCAYSRFYVA